MNTKSKEETIEKNEKLSVKNDAVFKLLFGKKGNEEYIKDFLSSLLKMDIKEIEVEHDVTLAKKIKEDKYGVLDLKAKLNGDIDVDIEIQLTDYNNMVQRATFYSTRMISTQLVSGDKYNNLKPVIVVAILDFDLFEFDEYITKSALVPEKHREYTIDTLQTYYYIELPKFRKSKIDLKDSVAGWLAFIDSEDEERIVEVMEKNEKIRKANEDLELLSADKEARELAEFRESSLREMASARDHGYSVGKRDGLRDGLREGKIKGIKEGIKEGEKKARKERNHEIVMSMLKENMDIEIISKITGLTKEEIYKISKK